MIVEYGIPNTPLVPFGLFHHNNIVKNIYTKIQFIFESEYYTVRRFLSVNDQMTE